jgi:hypothetical protein
MRARFLASAVFVSTLAVALPALAQDASPTVSAISREQFRAGVEAAHAARWPEALAAFARAYELAPQPVILFNLAGAQAQNGQLVRALESYRRFLREASTGPEASYRDAVATELRALESRIAHVRLVASGRLSTDDVWIDGEQLPRAALDLALPLDPGSHDVVLRRAGVNLAHTTVTLRESETRDAVLSLPVAVAPSTEARTERPRSVVVTVPPRAERSQRDTSHHGSVVSSPWLWTLIGVAVTGAAVACGFAFWPRPFMGDFGPGVVSVPP